MFQLTGSSPMAAHGPTSTDPFATNTPLLRLISMRLLQGLKGLDSRNGEAVCNLCSLVLVGVSSSKAVSAKMPFCLCIKERKVAKCRIGLCASVRKQMHTRVAFVLSIKTVSAFPKIFIKLFVKELPCGRKAYYTPL